MLMLYIILDIWNNSYNFLDIFDCSFRNWTFWNNLHKFLDIFCLDIIVHLAYEHFEIIHTIF